ncbi:formate dehydrogenase accessory protein FdhE [Thermus albus]|uniref:formate dehydrogenase accessory protein FdhE domain-containing protein n=1 Tax=Thermus albus TaxID=2908146 RepID=UPI001FAA39BA
MVEILEAVHRRLSLLPRRSGPSVEVLKQALEEVREAVEEVAPGFLSGATLPPREKLLEDAHRLRQGEVPEDSAYAFWLHQALRLISWQADHGKTSGEGWPERCPECGGFPDVGYLDADGHRFHLCAFCDTPFRALRLGCPYCGETRADQLVYYQEDPYRVYVCRSCGERLLVQDLRLKGELDLPALRARAALYALAEEKDVEV